MSPDDASGVSVDSSSFDTFSAEEIAALNAQINGQDFNTDDHQPLDPEPSDDDQDLDRHPADDQDDQELGGQQQQRRQAPDARQQPSEQEQEELDRANGVETVSDGRGGKQKRVSFHKYQRLEQQFNDLQGRYNNLETTSAADRARIEERLAIINEALETPQRGQQQQQQDDDPRPDPSKDIFAFATWAERQMQAMGTRLEQLEGMGREQQADSEMASTYRDLSGEFARTQPAFIGAYRHVMGQRLNELLVPHTRYGGADGNTPLPVDPAIRQKMLAQVAREEKNLVRKALADGVNPAQRIFQLATTRGFNPQAWLQAQQQQQRGNGSGRQQNGAGTQRNGAGTQQRRQPPVDPNALDADPGERRQQQPRQMQQRRPPAQQLDQRYDMDDDSGDIIDNINNGQRASSSLSTMRGSGGGSGMTLTPQDLARMSQEEFGDLVDRLSEGKLRELFGD